jgi:hypothetical protein
MDLTEENLKQVTAHSEPEEEESSEAVVERPGLTNTA